MPVSDLPRIWPMYFGDFEKPLFGCYLEPTGERRPCSIVICQPLGHEYINCHRALRQLSTRLCEEGFPVLRFDYHGCGDSSGDLQESSVEQWLKDISTAIAELRRRTGLAQVCLLGLRMGAALAALAALQRCDVESLVLWDPVIDGRSYLEETLSLQREMLRFRPKPRCRQKSDDFLDVLGFPVSRNLYSEIEKVRLAVNAWAAAKHVLVIESREETTENSRHGQMRRTLGRLEVRRVKSPEIWLPREDGSLLVPNQVLQTIVAWTCAVHS